MDLKMQNAKCKFLNAKCKNIIYDSTYDVLMKIARKI
jgi:hypothetical protein